MEYIDRNPGNSDRACRKRWKENLPKKRREGKKKWRQRTWSPVFVGWADQGKIDTIHIHIL